MTTSAPSKHDHEVQSAVETELQWAPDITADHIGVSAHDGIVTLTGQVSSYAQKVAAGRAAFRTRSVSAVANDISIHHTGDKPSDTDIATAARAALDTSPAVPAALVKVEVRDRFVILTGEVSWNYQREAARKAIEHLTGIKGVDNHITLTKRPTANVSQTEALIRSAITRQAAIDASKVTVRASGDSVELTGSVSSWAERHQAELAAWSSPFVAHVINRITIRP